MIISFQFNYENTINYQINELNWNEPQCIKYSNTENYMRLKKRKKYERNFS